MTLTTLHGRCELCTEPADSLAATVFGAACAACIADVDAHLAPCPACHDEGVIGLPIHDDVDDRPCPVCRPWASGFPGLRSHGRWIIERAAPGEPARIVESR